MNRLIRFSLLMMVSSVAHGQATLADYRLEPAGPHGVTLGYGQSSSVALTLTNPSASTADWRLAFANAGPSGLAGVLAGLDKNAAGVLAILPDRFLFSEGITGSSISDGGGDMYDGGNMLAAGATTLNYSNGVLANATAGSGSVSYFTRKLDGLFVMAADFNAVDSFAISGNLGADGSGLVSADEFTIASDGVTYRALVHRVYSAGDPSINQLILVPQKTGISRSFLPTTSNEDHRVSGLGASSRVYYLLFAKAGGGFYPTNVFQDLAAAFLGSFRSGPGWAFGDPSLGQVAAGKSGPVKITLSAAGLEPGTHSARFAVVPQSLADAAIPTATFRDLILQINPPTFTVAGGSPTVSTLAGLSPPPVTVPLAPAAAGSLLSGLQTSSSQPWLVPTPVPGSNAVQLTFNSSALAVGSYRATVDVWNGETRQSFEVSLVVSQLNVVKLLPDPARPRIYAINKNGKERGSILVIDTLTHAILKTISVGREPTDIDLTENAAELLVMNTTDRSISRINLSTLAVTATHQLTAFENQNEDFGGHVIDGPGNVLYYVDEQWGPRLRVYDTSTGTVLQTFGATTKGTSNDYGFGDIVVNPQKTALYGWVQYGDGAGWAGSFVVRYTIASNGTLTLADQGDSNYQTPMSREPYDSQALMTADGSRLVIKKRGVDLMDADLFPIVYPDDIYSMSTNGTIVATSSSLLPGTGGEVLHTLPVSATVQAILPDYSAMVYFNPTTQSITWLDLIATLGAERLGLRIGPADGATVARPERLQWFPVTGILRYQVYLGTNRSVVESATPASASYLGETANTWFDLATPPLAGQGYFWRVVPIAADGQAAGAGTTRAFFASNLTLSRSAIEAATVEGVMRHEETITLQAATPQAWSAAADVPWISFGNSSGTTPGELVARFNASSLAPGFHSGTITLTSGGASFGIPVSLRVYAANFMLAETDLELPWVYVISQENNNSTQPSFLLRINTATDRIESAVACGRSVTDLAVHYPENRVYLTNWQTGILRAFDRTTFKQVQTYQFAPVGAIGYGEGGIWRVAAGKQGRLILEEADQWIDIRLIDTANGAVIASNSTEYAGDGEADPSGRYYYHAEGTSSSDSMRRFDLAADTFATTTPTATAQGTSVVMIGDGSRVTAGSNVFNAQLGLQFALPAEVRAGTLHGDLLFTSSTAYNGTSGMEMATLPLSADLMSVTGNQEKLYLFPTNTKTFRVVDLASIAALPPREVTPTIVDGSTVIGRDQTLAWSLEPFANSYQVYFGTSRAAIDNANPTSASYLGSSSGNSWTGAQPALVLGGNYFWRVDTVGFAGTRKGVVWSFNVAPLEVTPRTLDLAFPVTSPIPRQRLALSSPTPRSWTATTSTPWIRLRTSTGSTPGSLEFDLDTAALSTGLKTGSITLQVGADTFSVPVRLQLLALNVTKLVAHPTRPVVYGINSAGTGEGFSYLLEIDAATANILRSLPIGFSPTDADLDAAGDRLYISNWGYPQTRVVNLADWLELPPLSLGSDVYKLEVSARGRIITEEQDQWIDIGMWNAATGASLAATGAREGDGETDPSGAFYYHCDSNISNAHITKYNISGDTFLQVASGPELGYGSRNLILSGNGSRLFWQSRVFDADLAPIAQMPGEVHATNRDGALAFGAGAVWWGDSGTTVGTLPFQSTVAAVSANDAQLVRFNPTTRTLHSTAISSFTDLPGPLPRPGQVLDTSPSRLWWSPVAGATDYRVFIAADHAALAAMSSPVATVSTPFYDLPSPLAFGRFYSWRVDAVTASGVTPGAIRSFTLQFPQGPALARIGNGSTGIAASISDRHLLVGGVDGTAQLYQYEPATGASSPLQNFTQPGYYWNHQFGSAVAVDAGKAAVGAYGLDNPADAGGSAFVYQAGDSNYWESSGPLSPPLPVAGESFGRSLAASGNLMLVGAGYNYQQPGRVAAYVTEPAAARLQTFGASDGQAGDGFGQVIAMEGNQALISAPGPGSSYNRLPAIYAFSRSTTTGLWTQTQKIAIAGATNYESSGRALALSGNYFATNNGSTDAVVIYAKNSSGQWIQSAIIRQSSVAGSTSYSFGNALAMTGTQIFIGDTGATAAGSGGGAVFSFRRSGSDWTAGPVLVPSGTRNNFGGALAARDGWLLATGTSPQPAALFHIDAAANHTPAFSPDIPTQVVVGRAFSTEVLASDADGNSELIIDLLQGPTWLALTDQTGGRATLSGTPAGKSREVHLVQIRVRDAAGDAQALHTYHLTLLSSTDLPLLTLQPAGGDVGEGQEVILRAAVSGIGPFKWQWDLDGEPIPGANRATLTLGEISLSKTGTYSVRVANAVGEITSSSARIEVHPANRFAGDWPTFGGSARHTGYHPARLGRHTFVTAWSASIAPGNALNRAAIGAGKVFVTPLVYFGGSSGAVGRELATGAAVWNHPFNEAFSINPPTYHNGRVYIQRGNHGSDSQLWALSASDGATVWSSPFAAQWERYESPAITDDGIWVNGGSYGGMYGFNLSGSERFFRSLAQQDGWTPTISGGRLFTWVGGIFQEHNPPDGATLWSLSVTPESYAGTGIAALTRDSAVLVRSSEIVCIDLPTRSIRWRRAGNFTGTAAISNGLAYAIQGAKVASFALADGTPGPLVTVPATIVSGQPLLVMGHLFVASSANTYLVDLATSAVVRTFAGGGLLSYSQGYLLAAGTDGTLRAWYANGAPEFTADLPATIDAGDAAPDFRLDLNRHVNDVDPGETLRWEIVSSSNPAIFRSLQIGTSSGMLDAVYHPWHQGTSSVVIAVTDSLGQRTEATLQFVLPVLPAPLVTADPAIAFSRLTGLYEQKVTITNVALREIGGFDLTIDGLRAGVTLYNGSNSAAGSGGISHHQPLAAGAAVAMIFEYYASPRGAIPLPQIAANVAERADLMNRARAATGEPAFAVNRCLRQPDGSVVIEFTAEPGQSYRIQYSADALHWKSCPVPIQAGGTKVQWTDRGPPWTDVAPASAPCRFYRVQRL